MRGHVVFQYGTYVPPNANPLRTTVPLFGVYANLDGAIEKVLASGDMLEGQYVYLAEIGPESLDDDQIAMNVLVGGREAIYIATLIPEPGTSRFDHRGVWLRRTHRVLPSEGRLAEAGLNARVRGCDSQPGLKPAKKWSARGRLPGVNAFPGCTAARRAWALM